MSDSLKNLLPEYLERLGLSTSKPFNCLSPEHDDKKPSMSYDAKHNRVKCFGCGATWDLYDLVAVEELGASVKDGKPQYSFKETKQKVEQLFAGKKAPDTRSERREGGKQAEKDSEGVIDHATAKSAQNGLKRKIEHTSQKKLDEQRAELIRLSQNSLRSDFSTLSEADRARLKPFREKAINYFHSRGISLGTAQRAKLGYVEKWRSQTALAHGKDPIASPRIIIPTSRTSYVARYAGEAPEGTIKKMKEGGAHFFNGGALLTKGPTFIVEGEFDALSVMEAGQKAIALGSTAMVHRFAAYVRWAKQNQPSFYPTLLLALDNDPAGQQATRKLTAELQRLGVAFYQVQIARGQKDPNAALQADPAAFKKDVAKVAKDPINRLQRWIDLFSNGQEQKAIPTGFNSLDKALDGGLYEGLYGLGAISSLGKTTFALQIADHIASQGTPVLFFALEMGWEEMTSKSISRLTAVNELAKGEGYDEHLAQTTRSLQRGDWKHNYNHDQYENLLTALRQYEQYAGRLIYRDGKEQRPSAKDVASAVDAFVAQTGERPVVVVDYLQLLAPVDPRATDKSAVTTSANLLKKIATRHHIPVVMISSFNRQKYDQPASMESFKESGDIEYSTDVLLGLQPEGVGESDFNVNEAKQADPRQVELVVLKNRNGRTGDVLDFSYTAPFNLFMDVSDGEAELPPFDPSTTAEIDGKGRLTGTQAFYSYETAEQVARKVENPAEEEQAEQGNLLPENDQGDGPAVLKGEQEVYGKSGKWYTSEEACRAAGDEPAELPF